MEALLREHGPKDRIYVCFISLMEFYYLRQQRKGEEEARRAYLQLKQLPLQVVESDEELALSAASIKATTRLSVADAWIAATAERLQATLVHKDPEYDQLKGRIGLEPLPFRARS